MGVSGSGKSAVGRALAARLGCPFYDGDDFHPPENIAKMANGTPLTDLDRLPWLTRINQLVHDHLSRGARVVVACSALKASYRTQLRAGNPGLVFVYLRGDYDTIQARMAGRRGHYMQPGMLASQFAALEPPAAGEALTADITPGITEIVANILEQLGEPHE
jgi:gluconokinase